MRLSGWQVPIEHLSASALALLIQCPEQFRLKRIKRIPESFGVDRFIGAVDHATHAVNLRQKIEGGTDLDIDKMFGIYQEQWDATLLDEGQPQWYDNDPVEVHDMGVMMVGLYHTEVSPTIKPIKVEERFETTFPGLPIPVIGYPDVEEKDRLVERKTSKSKLTKPKSKWALQGRIYSMVYDKPVDYHVITKQKTPQVFTSDTEVELRITNGYRDATLEMIQQAAVTLNDLWQRYGPDRPWPTNGIMHDWLCGYCSYGPKYGRNCVAWNNGDSPFDPERR